MAYTQCQLCAGTRNKWWYQEAMSRTLLALFLASCATAPAKVQPAAAHQELLLDVRFESDLEACVQLVPSGISAERNLLLLDVRFKLLQSIGECGCKSAVLGYRVRRNDSNHSSLDATGRLNTLGRELVFEEQVYLVLATDATMLSKAKTATIDVTCADPE